MNIILLSGGSGKRLWPLSNDVRSKQFIKIFKDENNTYESMVQRMHRHIKSVDKEAVITVATSKSQVSALRNHIGYDVGISVEPSRRDTFPAIALASAYLCDVKGIDENEVVVVCPVDPYVDIDYFEALKSLSLQAEKGEANLVLMGIEPTYPSEKYGYIIPENSSEVSRVVTFKEKPDASAAKEYINKGALWNGGVFAYKLKYVLDKARELLGYTDYNDLYSRYDTLKKISFDYAVVENESSIQVMRFSGRWQDLGTWNALVSAMEDDCIGKAMLEGCCDNVHVVNELDIPVLCIGVKNTVVCASADGILVTDVERSDSIKEFAEAVSEQIRFSEKSWGNYQVIDVSDESMTIKVSLKPHQKMSYHSHNRRSEVWNIISGGGTVVIDGVKNVVKTGDSVTINKNARHTVIAGDNGIGIIEVQVGRDISAKDKQKYKLNQQYAESD